MLDALRNMIRRRNTVLETEASELALLIASARNERGAITATLNALTAGSANLAPLAQSLEQATGQAAAVTARLDEIAKRVTSLDGRTQELGEIAARIQALKDAASRAEQTAKKATGPESDLQKHRQAVQLLSSQAREALAEHVAHKAKALESQQHAVEHAVVQASRVNEMVWSMDAQIARLTEGMKQAARADDTIARVEKLAEDTDKQLETRTKLRQETERETIKLTKEARAVVAAVRGQVDTLTAKKKEFDALDERVRALQISVGDGETRMQALSAKDKTLIALSQGVDSLTRQFQTRSCGGEGRSAGVHAAGSRNALRMLQHERELVERVAQGIRQLRAPGKTEDEKKTA